MSGGGDDKIAGADPGLKGSARDVELEPFNTLRLPGKAAHFFEAKSTGALIEATEWAESRGLPITILGGGSNIVVPFDGVPGLVLAPRERGLVFTEGAGSEVFLDARAGEPWEALVEASVERELAGIECLTGIPGLAGAAPIQNIGAYGKELSEQLVSVEIYDRRAKKTRVLGRDECGFGYRESRFKAEASEGAGSSIILGVRLRLERGGAPTIRYRELEDAIDKGASLREVRAKVYELRRAKSMVLDPADPNHRNAGSFFTNPILSREEYGRLLERALAGGFIRDEEELPRYPAGEGVKLAAAFLIERAGLRRGERLGEFGLSSKHTLCIVHHGGGDSRGLLRFAERIQARVEEAFGVRLIAEPRLFGPHLRAALS